MERTPRHLTLLAACALAASVILPVPGRAQVAVVEGGPSLIQQILNQLNTYSQRYQDTAEYSEQASRWMQTARHYQQQLIQAQGLFAGQGLTPGQTLESVPEDWNVAKKCGGGFDVATLVRAVTLDGDDLVTKQREICGRIQVAHNRKFNATVRFMTELRPKLDRHLQEIHNRRNSSNDEGNVNAVAVDAQNFDNWMSAEFKNWDMQMRMYDGYVAILHETQRTLSEAALKGDRSKPIGTPVKTAILQGALSR